MPKHGPVASEQDLEQLTGLFRLLSDKTRLNILMLLAAGERNVAAQRRPLRDGSERLPIAVLSHQGFLFHRYFVPC